MIYSLHAMSFHEEEDLIWQITFHSSQRNEKAFYAESS